MATHRQLANFIDIYPIRKILSFCIKLTLLLGVKDKIKGYEPLLLTSLGQNKYNIYKIYSFTKPHIDTV